jgi:hypothetical protein
MANAPTSRGAFDQRIEASAPPPRASMGDKSGDRKRNPGPAPGYAPPGLAAPCKATRIRGWQRRDYTKASSMCDCKNISIPA